MKTNTEPLRLMHVVYVLALGGMEHGVIKQVNRLDRRRFAPSICAVWFQDDSTRPLIDERVPVHALGQGESFNLRTVFRLASLLRRERIDVVHSHNVPTFLTTMLAARLARTPVIVHGEHGRETRALGWHRAAISRWLARRVARLTTVSHGLAGELLERWQLRPERVQPVPNGVDLDKFGKPHELGALREELGLTEHNPVVLTIGRIRPVKDHPTLLRAFARLHASQPDARLLLVGSSHVDSDAEGVKKLAEELGIVDAIRFTGIRHDVPQLFSLGDVYVNCSLFEGMSNTILEAMASRRAVVATAVGGNLELVTDGETGYLVPPRDDAQLAKRLERLVADPDLAARLGQAGRSKVERDHSLPRMVKDYAALYRESRARQEQRRARPAREHLKTLASTGLRLSGLGPLRARLSRNRLNILMYHRVLPLPDSLRYPFQSMVMPRDLFEAQMAHLARRYDVLPLPEALRRLHEGNLPPRAVALTFDDGYRDNYEHAWPVLRRYGLPATLYVVTDILTRNARLWWDELIEALRTLARKQARLAEALGPLSSRAASALEALPSDAAPERVAEKLVYTMNEAPPPERRQFLDALRALAKDAGTANGLMIDWDELLEMHGEGLHVGAHTMSHAFVDELDEPSARREIEGSIKVLEQRLRTPVRHFAYPRGRVAEKVKPLLRQAGIEFAVTTQPGLNGRDVDPLQLSRLDSGYFHTLGDFNPALFDAELQGWFSRFR